MSAPVQVAADEQIVLLPVGSIDPNPFQQREEFPDDYIQELADSMPTPQHLVQAVVARAHPTMSGRYQLVVGECRLRAHKLKGHPHIKAVVRACDDDQMEDIALIENDQRKDLKPMEAAKGYKRLLDKYGTAEAVATKTGKSVATVQARIALLALVPDVQTMVNKGDLNLQQAALLVDVQEPEEQLRIAKIAARAGMDVNRLKGMVKALDGGTSKGKKNPSDGGTSPRRVTAAALSKSAIKMSEDLEGLDLAGMKQDELVTALTQLEVLEESIKEKKEAIAARVRAGGETTAAAA